MKIISRYLSSSFILPFLVTLIFVLSFLVTFQMIKVVSLVMDSGVPVLVALRLMGHLVVYSLPIALPLSILFSTLFLFNRLSLDSEYTVMRSFGLSKHRIFLPVFLLAALLTLLIFELSRSIIPFSLSEFRNTIAFLTSKGYITNIKEGHFFTDIPGVTLFAEKVENEGTDMGNIFINLKAKDKPLEERVIIAKKGKLIKQNENEIGAASLRLKLFDGNITKLDANKTEIEKILFKTYDFPISSGQFISGAALKDNMKTTEELWQVIRTPPQEREQNNIQPDEIKSAKIEVFSRMNTALQCLVFVLLGFVFGVQPTRGKARNTGLMTVVVLIGYYAFYFLGLSIARSGKVEPFLVIFFPTLISAIFALYYYRKLDWVE